MCKIGGGTPDYSKSVPATPVYAPEPEKIAEEPVMDAEDKQLSSESASVRAKRKGARGLRTDLGFGGSASAGLGGLPS